MAAERFAGRIGPKPLMEWVAHALPWWQPGPRRPEPCVDLAGEGWAVVLAQGRRLAAERHPGPAARADYFAVCLAAHHATVGGYAPTDVDITIRGDRWADPDERVLEAQERTLRAALGWGVDGINPRRIDHDGRPVTGHDGEYLGALAGCVGGWLRRNRPERAAAVAELVEAELAREAAAVEAARRDPDPVRALVTAAIVTHNVGDLDQGLLHWPAALGPAYRARWTDTAHAVDRHGGAFARAAALYAATLAPEGHRNYPLRQVKSLRRDPSLWLPLGPFLDGWGRMVATTPHLGDADRIDVLAALIHGVATIPGQGGYQRAICGFAAAGRLDRLARGLTASQQAGLRHPAIATALKEDEPRFLARWRRRVDTLISAG
ncbi:MAG: hypothetical protein RLZZ127_1840 [Planctomycetota bacterium]|jgi:hypothetical protein